MDTMIPYAGNGPSQEPEADRQRRIAWEAACIAETRASAAAEGVIPSKAVNAWIDSWDTDHELPPPVCGQ